MRVMSKLVMTTISCAVFAPGALAQDPLILREMGVFYVSGQGREAAGPEQSVDQARVHYLVPDVKRPKLPVVMYPGLGLSSYIYMATPDGREGWAQAFAREGFSAYVYEPVTTDHSGFAAGPFAAAGNDIEPGLTPWSIDELWQRWGFGSRAGEPYPNTRFPTGQIEQFYASWPPRAGHPVGGGMGLAPPADDAADTLALGALLERTGRAVFLAHSEGGPVVFAAARRHPGLVGAIVLIEPTGCPTTIPDTAPIADIPFLAVYGDYIQSRDQAERLAACRITAELIEEHGGRAELLELTDERVYGNTHLMMQDDNNIDIAERIMRWIDRRAE